MAQIEEENTIDGIREEDLIDDAEVDTMVRESINQAIGENNQIIHSKLDGWTSNIIDGCFKRLTALSKPFKYIVTCNLSQKSGAGLHSASGSRWNDKTDSKLTVQWENAAMIVIVTIYWLAI